MFQLIEILIIAQILLETIPVSSSGHMLLIQLIVKQYAPGMVETLPGAIFYELSNIPTTFAVALFFLQELSTIMSQVIQFLQLTISSGATAAYARHCLWLSHLFYIVFYAILADFITFGTYLLHKKFIIGCATIACSQTLLAIGLVVSAIALLSLRCQQENAYQLLTWRKAIIIGFAQAMSLFPGASRFGLTYATARWLSISPQQSFAFSFLLHSGLTVGITAKTFIEPSINLECLTLYLTPNMLALITCATFVSLCGLALSYHLACTKQFWKFGLYYPLPLGLLLWLIRRP